MLVAGIVSGLEKVYGSDDPFTGVGTAEKSNVEMPLTCETKVAKLSTVKAAACTPGDASAATTQSDLIRFFTASPLVRITGLKLESTFHAEK